MLIVNDEQRLLAGVVSLDERCQYCSKPLTAYPLIMSDDVEQTVYRTACAVQVATEILVDLYTFFSPPAPTPSSLFSWHPKPLLPSRPLWRGDDGWARCTLAHLDRKEWQMQSTNIRQIKAALQDQALLGTARVSCPLGPVVAASRRKGQLRVMIRGWGHWYPVESVRIESAGLQLLS